MVKDVIRNNPFRFSFEIGLFVLFFSFGLGFQSFRNYTSTHRWVEHNHLLSEKTGQLRTQYLNLTLFFRGYLQTDDPKQLALFDQTENNLNSTLSDLKELRASEGKADESLNQTEVLLQSYTKSLRTGLPQDHKYFKTVLQESFERDAPTRIQIERAIENLEVAGRNRVALGLEDANRNLGLALAAAVTSAFLAILFMIASRLALSYANRQLGKHSAEAELALAAADRANNSKSMFLNNVRHEIRTPMNAIMGISEMLSGQNLTPDQRDAIALIRSSSQNLLALLNDLLDLSNVEAGKISIVVSTFDLQALIEESVQLLKPTLDKEVQLEIASDPNLPRAILTDRLRLKQILLNLLSNAIKSTEHGKITIQVSTTHSRTEDVAAETRTQLAISIEDSGPGLPADGADALFEPFHQGTGLGLAICKSLVNALEGKISAHNRPSGGACVSFSIPIEIGKPLSKPHAPNPTLSNDRPLTFTLSHDKNPDDHFTSSNGPLFSGRVLVIDELSANLTVAKMMLEKLGLQVTTAGTPKAGLDLLKNESFEMAFIDLRMSELDGAALAEDYRRHERMQSLTTHLLVRRPLTMIAISADSITGTPDSSLPGSFDAFVIKPFKLNALSDICSRFLHIARSESGAQSRVATSNRGVSASP